MVLQLCEKRKKRGRAKGGMIIGKKRGWGEKDSMLEIEVEEGIVVSRIVVLLNINKNDISYSALNLS